MTLLQIRDSNFTNQVTQSKHIGFLDISHKTSLIDNKSVRHSSNACILTTKKTWSGFDHENLKTKSWMKDLVMRKSASKTKKSKPKQKTGFKIWAITVRLYNLKLCSNISPAVTFLCYFGPYRDRFFSFPFGYYEKSEISLLWRNEVISTEVWLSFITAFYYSIFHEHI